jgi:hypothetical protein
MVAGVSAGSQVGVISMTAVRYAQPASSEPVMPVRRAQLVYANFRHIQVQPDSSLQGGVPLYKLKILDTLIDHLSPKQAAPRVDAASIDSVITGISQGLRGASYRAGFLPAPGAFVDLVA